MVDMNQIFSSRIFLIGYMAAGKSTIGRALSEAIGYDFLDTDQAIEKLNGQMISELFQNKGEQYFRNEEKKILKLTTDLNHIVVATGGGMPVAPSNMDLMNQSGTTVFIDTRLSTLIDRISKNSSRPLHNNKRVLEDEVKALYTRRLPYYSRAHITVTGDEPIEETVNLIRRQLSLVAQKKLP